MTTLVGLVGWRGMVGSVLMDRMAQERDFDLIEPLFGSFSHGVATAISFAIAFSIATSLHITVG